MPWNDYGEYAPISPNALADLKTIFASKFQLVFVEDNRYPNSTNQNHHQYRFEVHSDTTTAQLLSALTDAAFVRGA